MEEDFAGPNRGVKELQRLEQILHKDRNMKYKRGRNSQTHRIYTQTNSEAAGLHDWTLRRHEAENGKHSDT
eukprot:878465-Heterocapsa_arctica.AAC.1